MSLNKPAIAIVEDNTDLREELEFFLQHKGYPCWGVSSAEAFWKQLHQNPAQIVLLDIGLPGEDGLSVLSYLHNMHKFRMIVVTAQGDPEVHQQALQQGADLTLVKPISFSHLVSSIEALWFKTDAEPAPSDNARMAWQLNDINQSLITPDQQSLKLSTQEYALIQTLSANPGAVLSRESVAEIMFPHEQADGHRIDVILSRLRKKARAQQLKLPVHTIFGQGLVFTEPVNIQSN